MAVTIRRATPADALTVAKYNAALAWESEEKWLDPATLASGVAAVLADPAKGFYTVAEHAGEVVGQLMITFEWSDWRNGWFWWIQSVYVSAVHRRTGVFRSLFEAIQSEAAADHSVIGIRLYVEHDNVRAKQTYEALGLVVEPYGMMGLYPLPGRESAIGN